MKENENFFARPQNTTVLNKFKGRMDVIQTGEQFEINRNKHIQTIINSMAGAPDQWDKYCKINIEWIGGQFISIIADESKELTKEKIDGIFSMCFRFIFELYLSIRTELEFEFEKAKSFAFNNIDSFESIAKNQIEHAIRMMPIAIFKSIANSESIQSIKNFNELSYSADAKRKEWEKALSDKEARVNILKEALSKYESEFNFVGLFEGFNNLSLEKKTEKKNLLFWLNVLGILIVSPLVVEIVVLYLNLDNLDKVKNVLALSIVPTISLVAIFIYYFRVILFNYKAAKSQLLQIELRKTLCRFIQHYFEFASNIKEKDKGSLEKFENIIFSGIVSDEEMLPTTFDGVEQLGKLLKSIKQ